MNNDIDIKINSNWNDTTNQEWPVVVSLVLTREDSMTHDYEIHSKFRAALCEKLNSEIGLNVFQDFEFVDAYPPPDPSANFMAWASNYLQNINLPIKIKMKEESFALLKLKYYGR